MALLEEEELIAAPHTSSGRVPTDKGYRVFVDQLAEVRPLTPAQRHAIETFLGESGDLDDVLARTVRAAHAAHRARSRSCSTRRFARARVSHVELVQLAPEPAALRSSSPTPGASRSGVVELERRVDDETLADAARAAQRRSSGGRAMADAAERALAAAPTAPHRAHAAVPRIARARRSPSSSRAHRQDRLVMAGAANLARTEQRLPRQHLSRVSRRSRSR